MAKAKIKSTITNESDSIIKESKQLNLSMGIASESVDETVNEQSQITTSKFDEKIVVKIKSGQKLEWKKFFGSYGKNLSDGVRMCVDYVFQGVKEGTLKISDCGIRENRINDLLDGRYN